MQQSLLYERDGNTRLRYNELKTHNSITTSTM